MRWIAGAWLAGGLLVLWTGADARMRSRMVCEEWRDYYYSVDTGEFLGWAGDPYMQCYFEDEPISVPASPTPDGRPGWGIPREPSPAERCEKCAKNKDACDRRTERGLKRCLEHYEKHARMLCVTTRRDRQGNLLDDYTCKPIRDPRGKPIVTCFGPGIERCVDDYARDHPETTITDTETIDMGADWWGVGGTRTTAITWGGSRGFRKGCRMAINTVQETCLATLNTCEEAAGGCR